MSRARLPDPVKEVIDSWIESKGGCANADQIKDIILTALFMVEDDVDRGDLKIMNSALRELRRAFKVFSPFRNIRKVSIFGSARTPKDHPHYQQAKEFGRKIVDKGWMVITGAASGIMAAGMEGAGREKSLGAGIQLPLEQEANEFMQDESRLVEFKYFFTRKLTFVKESDAICLFPGGFGTHDEGFESLTLVQTGKTEPKPLVFVDVPGGTYWQSWHDFVARELLGHKVISPEDLDLYKITTDIDEAINELVSFYSNYHSSRWVRKQFVIRVRNPISNELLEALNQDFKDMLEQGAFEAAAALPAEANEPELAHLPRLVFNFNRVSYGRLRHLINRLNQQAAA
ncbi:MAG: TIGR00730 family Rossman fold protein [Candidatus Omnitrophica bacterium]|nr:TIGR00730 family Rossman fold protein [Candidatus Omnitrophota bacterium]